MARNHIKMNRKARRYLITKPLILRDDAGVTPILKKLVDKPNLYWLTGCKQVGKTAFCFKLLYHFLSNYKNACVVFFDLSGRINYWQSNFQSLIHLSDEELSFISVLDSSLLIKELNDQLNTSEASLIIVDGFESMKITHKESRELIKLFLQVIKKRSLSIIVTQVNNPSNVKLKKYRRLVQSRTEEWHLARPTFIRAPIKEFGDTILFIN